MNAQVIQLEDGWNKLKTGGVLKIEEILEDASGGVYKHRISTDEYSQLYTCALPPLRPAPPQQRAARFARSSFAPASAVRRTVYTMCTQKPPNNWSEPLYNNYCEAVIDYLTARILPRIKEKHDEAMLRVRRRAPRRPSLPVTRIRARRSLAASRRALVPRVAQELVRRWENHKTIIRFLSHVFKYLVRAPPLPSPPRSPRAAAAHGPSRAPSAARAGPLLREAAVAA
jgi:hypothetical protein